jgi:hypothetical protein
MYKQLLSFLVIILLSAVVVMFMPQAQTALQYLVDAHDWVSHVLMDVFNVGHTGSIAREIVALLTIPILAGFIPAIIFFVLRKRWLTCFLEIIWVVWLLQAGALVMTYTPEVATPVEGPAKTAPAVAEPQSAPEAK